MILPPTADGRVGRSKLLPHHTRVTPLMLSSSSSSSSSEI
jgi:hypothetical protein